MNKLVKQYEKEKMLKDKKIIVLEGIDGSGKTSQILRLKNTLKNQGRNVKIMCESKNKLAENLGNHLKKGESLKQMLLFGALRVETIKDMLESEEEIVIYDRFILSSIAYQCQKDIRMEVITKRVNELILSFYGVKPLLTIYLNIEIQEAIKRIENREQRKVNKEEEKILRKAKLLYEKHSNEMKVINSNQTIEEVSSEIEKLVKNVI
ncbi:MAG: dTMP kinase [Trichodesmium sp. St17_bin3_1_1]|nr:dTMP kinase [Trichodesmium sp. St17_bin3_1_1]